MTYKPWMEKEEELGSHLSYMTNQMIGELLAGAHLSAMRASNLFLEGVGIRMEINKWYNALRRVYVATISLLNEKPKEKAKIDAEEKKFKQYFKELNTRPDNRKKRMHFRKLEELCMNHLNEMHILLTDTLQKYYFFFRFKDDNKPTKGFDNLRSKENVTKWAKELGYELKKAH